MDLLVVYGSGVLDRERYLVGCDDVMHDVAKSWESLRNEGYCVLSDCSFLNTTNYYCI